MKTWYRIIGGTEIILALVAVFVAITSSQPDAGFGYVLALVLVSTGRHYIILANKS